MTDRITYTHSLDAIRWESRLGSFAYKLAMAEPGRVVIVPSGLKLAEALRIYREVGSKAYLIMPRNNALRVRWPAEQWKVA